MWHQFVKVLRQVPLSGTLRRLCALKNRDAPAPERKMKFHNADRQL